MVTIELYEYFASHGHSVQIFTNFISDRFKSIITEKKLPIYDAQNFMSNQDFDLIWVHHGVLPRALLSRDRVIAKFIFHHMSPFEPFELPFLLNIESKSCLILSNSEETKKKLVEFGLAAQQIQVFNNPAPSAFWNEKRDNKPLNNILVISNHLPDEALQAIDTLQNKYSIRVLGHGPASEGNRRLTKEDLDWADAIFSIGKSVQYGIVGGIPVYVYDIYGGPGWITDKETFNRALNFNFSGRGFEKKTSDQIVSEIDDRQYYDRALSFLSNLSISERKQFQYNEKMKLVWDYVRNADKRYLNLFEKNQWFLIQEIIAREHLAMRHFGHNYTILSFRWNELNQQYQELNHQYQELNHQYQELKKIKNLLKYTIKKFTIKLH